MHNSNDSRLNSNPIKQHHESIKTSPLHTQSSMTVLFPCLTPLKTPSSPDVYFNETVSRQSSKTILPYSPCFFLVIIALKHKLPPIYAISPILLNPLSEPRLRARPWLLLRILMNPVTGPLTPSCSTLKLAKASSPGKIVSKCSDN